MRPYASTFFVSLLAALGWAALRIARRERPDAGLFVLLFVAAHAAMVATTGGDWMRGGRFFAQFAPITLVIAAGVLHRLPPAQARGGLRSGHRRALQRRSAPRGVGLRRIDRPPAVELSRARPAAAQLRTGTTFGRSAPTASTRATCCSCTTCCRASKKCWTSAASLEILSPQAGMVTYYLTQRHCGRIRFIDLHGLTSRDATRLASTIGAGHGRVGVEVSPAELVAALEREGGTAARPD